MKMQTVLSNRLKFTGTYINRKVKKDALEDALKGVLNINMQIIEDKTRQCNEKCKKLSRTSGLLKDDRQC
jgi:hypothetical protein